MMRKDSAFYVHICRWQIQYCSHSPQAQDVNWTYIRRWEDVQDVFWTLYVRSVYVLFLQGWEIWSVQNLEFTTFEGNNKYKSKIIFRNKILNLRWAFICKLFLQKTPSQMYKASTAWNAQEANTSWKISLTIIMRKLVRIRAYIWSLHYC